MISKFQPAFPYNELSLDHFNAVHTYPAESESTFVRNIV